VPALQGDMNRRTAPYQSTGTASPHLDKVPGLGLHPVGEAYFEEAEVTRSKGDSQGDPRGGEGPCPVA